MLVSDWMLFDNRIGSGRTFATTGNTYLGDKMSDKIDAIVMDSAAHGFEWGFGPVHKKIDGNLVMVCEHGPYIRYTDVDLACATFGKDHFLDMANGTSGKVRDQEAVRGPCALDHGLRGNRLALQRLVIERALGQRASRGRTVTVIEKIVERYADIGGNFHATQAEAMAASIDIMQERQQA